MNSTLPRSRENTRVRILNPSGRARRPVVFGSLFTSQDQPDDDGKDDRIDKDIDHISPFPLDPRTSSARASVVMVAGARTNGTMGNPGRSAILM